MNLIKKLSIGKQMLVLVAAAVLGVASLTVLSWSKVQTVYETTNFANENTVPSWIDLDEALKDVTWLRVRVWQHIAEQNASTMTKLEQQLLESTQSINTKLDKYERDDMDEPEAQKTKDAALLAADRDALAAYTKLEEKVLQLSSGNKKAEATELLLNNQEIPKQLVAAFENHVQFNIDMTKAASTEAATVKSSLIVMVVSVGVLIALLVAGLGYLIAQAITAPIEAAVQTAENISQGNVGVRLEMGDVASHTESGRLLHALQTMDAKLCEIVGAVSGTAESVGSAAREIAQGNDDLSSRTQEQASALQQTAATMEEMTATVKRNSDNANQADQLGRQARNQADGSAEVVQKTVAAMGEINTSSRKIGDIINVIDEIAFQTNLLALNAAVEAARAGEQGRGFAVVASEVRNLAQRSASAAKEIKTLIQDSMNKVNTGTELVNASGKALNDIVVDVKRVTDIVAEIAAASAEQADGINQINNAVTQMDVTTQQNAALVEQAASASRAMEEQAQELIERVNFFRINGQVRTSARPIPTRANKPTPVKATPRVANASAPVYKRASGDDHAWTEF